MSVSLSTTRAAQANSDAPNVAEDALCRVDRARILAIAEPLVALDNAALSAELAADAMAFGAAMGRLVGARPGRLRRILRSPSVAQLVRHLLHAADAYRLEQVFAEDADLSRLVALSDEALLLAGALGTSSGTPRAAGDPEGLGALLVPAPTTARVHR